jgi:hypothetical protein
VKHIRQLKPITVRILREARRQGMIDSCDDFYAKARPVIAFIVRKCRAEVRRKGSL